MANNSTKPKRSPLFYCGCGCLAFPLICVLLLFITYHVRAWLSESTIFLETENITLVKTRDIHSFQNDPRAECFYEEVNRISVNPRTQNGEIILTENDDFFVIAEEVWVRSCVPGISPRFPRDKFENNVSFSFYRVKKDVSNGKPYVVKTEFLGSIKTNMYDAWNYRGRGPHRISISPDGKYIVMSAGTVDSRSLGEFRNKAVLLIWEVGDNVVEKDVLTKHIPKKIPIIIKTEEELQKEKEEEEKKNARNLKSGDIPANVGSFNATLIDSTSIKLTWDQARGADKYRIYQGRKVEEPIRYRQDMLPNQYPIRYQNQHYVCSLIATTDFSSCEYIVTGLSPNTTYLFEIIPVNSNNERSLQGFRRRVQAATLP